MTTSKKGDGVVPGVYDITVSAYSGTSLSREQVEAGDRASGPKLLIPSKYLEPGSSGLSDTVDSDHSGFKRIELNE